MKTLQKYYKTGQFQVSKPAFVEYGGKKYLKFKAVTQVADSIIFAHGSHEDGDFLPADTLDLFPKQRNGRPVTYDHPWNGKEYVMCSDDKEIRANNSIGFCDGFQFDGKQMEGYLLVDVEALEAKDKPLADHLVKGNPASVSEGWMGLVNDSSGETESGEKYGRTVLFMINDHVAILPLGVDGACSQDMGCKVSVNMKGKSMEEKKKPGIWQSFLDKLTGKKEEVQERLDSAIVNSLIVALSNIEGPYNYWMVDHDSQEGYVIYQTYSPDKMFKRYFAFEDDGSVTFSGDRVEVKVKKTYEEVGNNETITPVEENEESTEETVMAEVVEEKKEETPPVETPVVETSTCQCGKVHQKEESKPTATAEDFMKLFPAEMRQAFERIMAEENSARTKAEGVLQRNGLKPEDFKHLSTESLQTLANRLVGGFSSSPPVEQKTNVAPGPWRKKGVA